MSISSNSLSKYSCLVTGGAGFIGSHLVDELIKRGARKVVVLDDLSTGNLRNIQSHVSNGKVEFIEGSIVDYDICDRACQGIDVILHEAALGSVPRSIKDPVTTHRVNSSGFLNMLKAASNAGVKRFIYASSSSVYGDSIKLPKVENEIGFPMSPYAVTKRSNELNAGVHSDIFGLEVIGLRYFNIFGPRQNPEGPYAAVIPLFIEGLSRNSNVTINGDGEQTRDFTYVKNAIEANMNAITTGEEALGKVYNIASGNRVSINELFNVMKEILGSTGNADHGPPRKGDVRDSFASIELAREYLGYEPVMGFKEGLVKTLEWYKDHATNMTGK